MHGMCDNTLEGPQEGYTWVHGNSIYYNGESNKKPKYSFDFLSQSFFIDQDSNPTHLYIKNPVNRSKTDPSCWSVFERSAEPNPQHSFLPKTED